MQQTCSHCDKPVVGRKASATYCNERCRDNAAAKRRYDKNPEKYRAKALRSTQKMDHIKRLVTAARYRATQNGIDFDIEAADLQVPETCPVLGIPLGRGLTSLRAGSSASLDRIDPGQGYVRGNVRVISMRANLIKSNATELELTAVLLDARRLQREASDGKVCM